MGQIEDRSFVKRWTRPESKFQPYMGLNPLAQ